MVPGKIRELAPKGCVGIHASLLPKYRGGAPINWAIINGEKMSGVSLFYLGDGVDNGDIISKKRFPISDTDSCREVYDKATRASIEILKVTLPKLAAGTANRIPQNESEATCFPQRNPNDGRIDWRWRGRTIYNFIRAQTKPYPGAFTYLRDEKITIWQGQLTGRHHKELKPGEVIPGRNGTKGSHVVCGDGAVMKVIDMEREKVSKNRTHPSREITHGICFE
jgi:methionyl-tRNA formyltransferase